MDKSLCTRALAGLHSGLCTANCARSTNLHAGVSPPQCLCHSDGLVINAASTLAMSAEPQHKLASATTVVVHKGSPSVRRGPLLTQQLATTMRMKIKDSAALPPLSQRSLKARLKAGMALLGRMDPPVLTSSISHRLAAALCPAAALYTGISRHWAEGDVFT